MRTLETLQFDNTFARLPEVFYAKVTPTPLKSPFLVAFNPDAAALLDLDPEEARRPEFAGCLAGHYLPPGSEPLAMVYAGHQFGAYVSRLGDGRAILLGEVRNSRGEKWDLHLKGAGLTPFSRDDDGRAVLRSCIREYLCGEAMHGLGIPTTRALCVVGSEEEVLREQVETGATLLRLAPSHVRFGHFEFFYWRRQFDHLKTLADYVLAQHFPELVGRPDSYARFYHEAAVRTARLIAEWQAVGFAHGVMNSDNMSVLGMTLDYGPFGFLDAYDPAFICNHSDHQGRYAFHNQPDIGYFNLRCLAQALTPLAPDEAIKAGLDAYEAVCADAGERRRLYQRLPRPLRLQAGAGGTERDDQRLFRGSGSLRQVGRAVQGASLGRGTPRRRGSRDRAGGADEAGQSQIRAPKLPRPHGHPDGDGAEKLFRDRASPPAAARPLCRAARDGPLRRPAPGLGQTPHRELLLISPLAKQKGTAAGLAFPNARR